MASTSTAGISEEMDNSLLPIILDGTFFNVQSIDKGTSIVTAKCCNCVKDKFISGGLPSTANFLTHLWVSIYFLNSYSHIFNC